MLLNVPTLYAIGLKDKLFNSIERARLNKVSEEIGVSLQPLTLSGDEFKKLSPEKQKEFISQMARQKNSVRNDSVIGERGSLGRISGFISVPVLSAFAWGLIGVVIYMMGLVKKKFSNTGV